MSKSREVRGNKLIEAIKSAIPGAGFIKPDESSSGRKVFFEWRKVDFVVSSRLIVQECGFGRKQAFRAETDETNVLAERLKAATC